VTPTTLYTNTHLTVGSVALTKTAFTANVGSFNLVLKLEALLNPDPNKFRSIVLRCVTLNDVGTFTTAATHLPQLVAQSSALEVLGKLPDLQETIKYYKTPLTPVEGTHLYTWLEVAGVATDEIQATLILNAA